MKKIPKWVEDQLEEDEEILWSEEGVSNQKDSVPIFITGLVLFVFLLYAIVQFGLMWYTIVLVPFDLFAFLIMVRAVTKRKTRYVLTNKHFFSETGGYMDKVEVSRLKQIYYGVFENTETLYFDITLEEYKGFSIQRRPVVLVGLENPREAQTIIADYLIALNGEKL